MTTCILSPPRTSTRGREPVLSMIIRFWINVDSLKRPPTLFTISSSFNSSYIPILLLSATLPEALRRPGSGKKPFDHSQKLPRRLLQIVIDDDVIILADSRQFATGGLH